MSKINNGDMPAMPCDDLVLRDNDGNLHGFPVTGLGLNKREKFAAMALQAMISSRYYSDFCGKYDDKEVGIAISAIDHADALLSQLEKGDE